MSAAASGHLIRFGPFEFDPTSGLLFAGEQETLLPPKAAGVLRVLLENAGELVSKDEILESVWAGSFVTESSLTDAVSLLRQVLGDDSQNPTYIQTLHRRGYRFVAELEAGPAGEPRPADEEAAAPAASPSTPPVESAAIPHEDSARAPPVYATLPPTVSVGARLGQYEVLEKLGAGSMGEVYRARDTVLERDVAIKILPTDFAADPDRVARFEREAKLLAAVSHPNIAAIHSLEECDGIRCPVLELVEGETLDQRLRSSRITVDEALELGRQIASALEAAHEQGIVHRDLKPANIKVTPEGQVKVLDFGLAKALEVKVFGTDASESPTESIAVMGSRRGSIVGTAAYMSPEQARGQEVDKRADIWSFGGVLYELLTGRRAFAGETVSDTIAGVLERGPDWTALPSETPALARSLLRRCLQKDPANRLHDIADARIEIEESVAEPGLDTLVRTDAGAEAPPGRRSKRATWGAIGITVGVALGTLASGPLRRAANETPVQLQEWQTTLEPGLQLFGIGIDGASQGSLQRPSRTAFALAPDDSYLVYAASTSDSVGFSETYMQQGRLYIRWIDEVRARAIPGTESGSCPFLSPDGEWIGFWQWQGRGSWQMKKVAVGSGVPGTVLPEAPLPWGASWGDDGTILFANGEFGAIKRVGAAGGSPETVTTIDHSRGETAHRLPHMLPGSRAFLFTVMHGISWDRAAIAVRSLDSDVHRVLIEDGADARYVATGHLLFMRRGTLMAAPFDLESLQTTAEPLPALENVMQAAQVGVIDSDTGAGQFSVSGSGMLAYVPGGLLPGMEESLVWVRRDGTPELLVLPLAEYGHPRLSPDGRFLAYDKGESGTKEIWLYDLERKIESRLVGGGHNWVPIWSPDSQRIAFSSNRDGPNLNLYWTRVDGTGEPTRLTRKDRDQVPSSWSTKDVLAFVETSDERGYDIWVLPLDGEAEARPFVATPTFDLTPAFSPDGNWLAYRSAETGRAEIHVRPFPGFDPRIPISTSGGARPAWSKDGQKIFFRGPTDPARPGQHRRLMMVADFSGGDPEAPRLLLDGPPYGATQRARNYDVTPDGFIMASLTQKEPEPVKVINVILNWFEELKTKVPTGR